MKADAKKQVKPDIESPVQARLRNWYRVGDRLHGYVYDHPRPDLPDREFIITSTVLLEWSGYAQTRNTLYKLEEPLNG